MLRVGPIAGTEIKGEDPKVVFLGECRDKCPGEHGVTTTQVGNRADLRGTRERVEGRARWLRYFVLFAFIAEFLLLGSRSRYRCTGLKLGYKSVDRILRPEGNLGLESCVIRCIRRRRFCEEGEGVRRGRGIEGLVYMAEAGRSEFFSHA